MTRLSDGFDAISGANGTRKSDAATGTLTPGFAGIGSGLLGPASKNYTLGANYAVGWLSFDWYTATIQSHLVAGFMDALSVQGDLRVDGTGVLTLTRNGTVLGTAASPVANNTWYPVVIKIKVHDTLGTFEVRLNGTSVISVSGVDTKNTANAFFNQLYLNSAANRLQIFDNMVFWDDATKAAGSNDLDDWNTNPLTVDPALVIAAGDNADFTPSAGTNDQTLDETLSNDADYNESANSGDVDTFVVAPLHSTSGTIIAIAMNTEDVLSNATPFNLKHRYRSGSSNTDSAAFTVTGSIKNHQTIITLDPATGAAPTVSARNAMKFGYTIP